MTEEEFNELVRAKIKDANLPQYANKITDIICDVYQRGLCDGMKIAREIRQQ